MHIALLGPLEIIDDDNVRFRLPGEKLRAIVAVLALSPGKVVSRDELIDELWEEHPPRDAVNSLQGHIARLRRLLVTRIGQESLRGLVQTTPAGYSLQVPGTHVDALRFTALVEGAAPLLERDPESALATLDSALALWRGPALYDTGQGLICRMAYAHLEETRLIAQERRIDSQLDLGMHQVAIPELERLHMRHPLREHFCRQLMTALFRSGRQCEAINAYSRTRQRLVRDLGLEPGAQLRDTFDEILSQA
ncbi:BTAD domain-containing putative transcriptional regulator [Streptomyces sp. LN549]|uniref:AfsR/SARP family transcriptional regulator n=1 Tax=Streptomyces sp. LN549 TaxID=3112979 RepID=UPI003720655D